jgi:tetratricopeptide (TPR) repeat protein
VCLVKTYSRNEQWRNDFTLFTADASTSSNSIKANLAASVSYLLESQKVDDSELIGVYRTRALEHSKKAVALYERHIDVDRLRGTSYGHALTLLCDCYGANGMLEDTLQCYKKAIRSVSDRDPLYETMETTISKSNDPDFKIRNYLELVALAPDNFLFNYRLGYLYGREKSDLTRSIQYLQKAVELRPKESHALEALAHAYKLSKDYDRAALYLEKAAAENADSTAHLTRLLDIYRLAGNREKEIEVVNRLSRLQQ